MNDVQKFGLIIIIATAPLLYKGGLAGAFIIIVFFVGAIIFIVGADGTKCGDK